MRDKRYQHKKPKRKKWKTFVLILFLLLAGTLAYSYYQFKQGVAQSKEKVDSEALAYVIYGLFFYWYLFHFADTSLQFEYEGTRADPATFLNGRELMLSEEYSKVRNLLFFLSTPFEWLFYLFVLLLGLGNAFKKWAGQSSKFKAVQSAIYLFWLSLFAFASISPSASKICSQTRNECRFADRSANRKEGI